MKTSKTYRLNEYTITDIERVCKETGLNATQVVEDAIRKYMILKGLAKDSNGNIGIICRAILGTEGGG